MSEHPLENYLRQTLEDYRLSRTERKALRNVLNDLDMHAHDWRVLRSIAFRLAKEAIEVSAPTRVLDWLEDVNQLLIPQAEPPKHLAECLFAPQDDCPARIVSLFNSAREGVDVCVFTITDDRITQALLEAEQRGVHVRIISDDEKAFDAGSDIQRLQDAGVEVRVDRSPHHMHHKFAVFDNQRLLTGSYNWTRGAANHNDENLMLTDDPRFVGQFLKLFERLWREYTPR